MSRRDDLDPVLEQELRELLRDAVAGVQPEDRLGELRARVSRPSRRRPALLALGGAVLAGATAVVAVAVVGPQLGGDDPDDTPVASAPPSSSQTPEPSASATPRVPTASRSVAGYYLGDGPTSTVLFREFRSVEAADEGPAASVRLLTTTPQDPDYRTEWPEGSFAGAEIGDDRITVELADAGLADRPSEMSEEDATASVQQVVYTLQAYAQQRLPVEFTTADGPVGSVLGTPVDGPVADATATGTLSRVNLTDPAEGEAASGRLRVDGVAAVNEGNVQWSLTGADGTEVDSGFFTAAGGFDRLYPFGGNVDLTALDPGTYVLEVQDGDESGGQEGFGPSSDTRTVVVE